MRRFLVFLLIHAVATNAVAQPAPPLGGAPATPAVETGITPDGKIKLGLEGRGNYRKAKKAKLINVAAGATPNFKQAMQGPPANKPAATNGTAAPTTPAANTTEKPAPTPVATTAPTPAPAKGLRSDRDLFSANNPAQPPAPTPAVAPVLPNALPALQPNGGLYPQR